MGIQGLIPFLKKASQHANIKDFKGCTVAIDSYCWLHRGAFACAEKLALGEKTDQYVFYCMKYVNNLLSFGIKPIMVFDGCRLPSKRDVEKARRERRDLNRKKAAALLREGNRTEARDCLAQCIDISPQMALDLMNACRAKGVDCIVAPYEADAQLAYLNKIGVAQIIITEDSDLVLFGCEKVSFAQVELLIAIVMFKMDINGNGLLYDRKDLNKSLGLHPDHFTFDKFRYMCIMSGCDYLANLPGIGLGKAGKVFKISRQDDMAQVLRKLPVILNMSNLVVPPDYIDSFFRANDCFLYQLVFDPLQRKLVPLNPYPPNIDPKTLYYAGPTMCDDRAFQIALGNINVNTGEVLGNYDPDSHMLRTSSWSDNAIAAQTQSIWSRHYIQNQKPLPAPASASDMPAAAASSNNTRGKEIVIKAPLFRSRTVKRAAADDYELSDDYLSRLYRVTSDAPSAITIAPSGAFIDSLFPKAASPDVSILNSSSDIEQRFTRGFKEVEDNDCKPGGLVDFEPYSVYGINNGDADLMHSETSVCSKIESYSTDITSPSKRLPLSPSNHNSLSTMEYEGVQCTDVNTGKENGLSRKRLGSAMSVTSADDDEAFISPDRKRNIFAVSGGSDAKPKFMLNMTKRVRELPQGTNTEIAEVKSRFFTAARPKRETTFFKELKKEHIDVETVATASDRVQSDEEVDADCTLGKNNDNDDDDDDDDDKLDYPTRDLANTSKNVEQAKLDGKLSFSTQPSVRKPNFSFIESFRSSYDRRQNASLMTKVERPQSVKYTSLNEGPAQTAASATKIINQSFKPVLPARPNPFAKNSQLPPLSNSPSNSSSSVETMSSKTQADADNSFDDRDSESPWPRDCNSSDASFTALCENANDDRNNSDPEAEEDPTAGLQFLSPSSRVSSKPFLKVSLDDSGTGVLDGICKRFSLDTFPRRDTSSTGCTTMKRNEAKSTSLSSASLTERKTSVVARAGLRGGGGCRTSGLSKNNSKTKDMTATKDLKQSAISVFFHSTFGYDKRNVEKIPPH